MEQAAKPNVPKILDTTRRTPIITVTTEKITTDM